MYARGVWNGTKGIENFYEMSGSSGASRPGGGMDEALQIPPEEVSSSLFEEGPRGGDSSPSEEEMGFSEMDYPGEIAQSSENRHTSPKNCGKKNTSEKMASSEIFQLQSPYDKSYPFPLSDNRRITKPDLKITNPFQNTVFQNSDLQNSIFQISDFQNSDFPICDFQHSDFQNHSDSQKNQLGSTDLAEEDLKVSESEDLGGKNDSCEMKSHIVFGYSDILPTEKSEKMKFELKEGDLEKELERRNEMELEMESSMGNKNEVENDLDNEKDNSGSGGSIIGETQSRYAQSNTEGEDSYPVHNLRKRVGKSGVRRLGRPKQSVGRLRNFERNRRKGGYGSEGPFLVGGREKMINNLHEIRDISSFENLMENTSSYHYDMAPNQDALSGVSDNNASTKTDARSSQNEYHSVRSNNSTLSRRGGRARKKQTKYDAAYKQMERLDEFDVERTRTDMKNLDSSSVPYEVLSDPSLYSYNKWHEGFSIRLGADGRRLLLRKLRQIYGENIEYWGPIFQRWNIDQRNVFTMATVTQLFKIAYIMGQEAWDFALKCACFTHKCNALKQKDNPEDKHNKSSSLNNNSDKHSYNSNYHFENRPQMGNVQNRSQKLGPQNRAATRGRKNSHNGGYNLSHGTLPSLLAGSSKSNYSINRRLLNSSSDMSPPKNRSSLDYHLPSNRSSLVRRHGTRIETGSQCDTGKTTERNLVLEEEEYGGMSTRKRRNSSQKTDEEARAESAYHSSDPESREEHRLPSKDVISAWDFSNASYSENEPTRIIDSSSVYASYDYGEYDYAQRNSQTKTSRISATDFIELSHEIPRMSSYGNPGQEIPGFRSLTPDKGENNYRRRATLLREEFQTLLSYEDKQRVREGTYYGDNTERTVTYNQHYEFPTKDALIRNEKVPSKSRGTIPPYPSPQARANMSLEMVFGPNVRGLSPKQIAERYVRTHIKQYPHKPLRQKTNKNPPVHKQKHQANLPSLLTQIILNIFLKTRNSQNLPPKNGQHGPCNTESVILVKNIDATNQPAQKGEHTTNVGGSNLGRLGSSLGHEESLSVEGAGRASSSGILEKERKQISKIGDHNQAIGLQNGEKQKENSEKMEENSEKKEENGEKENIENTEKKKNSEKTQDTQKRNETNTDEKVDQLVVSQLVGEIGKRVEMLKTARRLMTSFEKDTIHHLSTAQSSNVVGMVIDKLIQANWPICADCQFLFACAKSKDKNDVPFLPGQFKSLSVEKENPNFTEPQTNEYICLVCARPNIASNFSPSIGGTSIKGENSIANNSIGTNSVSENCIDNDFTGNLKGETCVGDFCVGETGMGEKCEGKNLVGQKNSVGENFMGSKLRGDMIEEEDVMKNLMTAKEKWLMSELCRDEELNRLLKYIGENRAEEKNAGLESRATQTDSNSPDFDLCEVSHKRSKLSHREVHWDEDVLTTPPPRKVRNGRPIRRTEIMGGGNMGGQTTHLDLHIMESKPGKNNGEKHDALSERPPHRAADQLTEHIPKYIAQNQNGDMYDEISERGAEGGRNGKSGEMVIMSSKNGDYNIGEMNCYSGKDNYASGGANCSNNANHYGGQANYSENSEGHDYRGKISQLENRWGIMSEGPRVEIGRYVHPGRENVHPNSVTEKKTAETLRSNVRNIIFEDKHSEPEGNKNLVHSKEDSENNELMRGGKTDNQLQQYKGILTKPGSVVLGTRRTSPSSQEASVKPQAFSQNAIEANFRINNSVNNTHSGNTNSYIGNTINSDNVSGGHANSSKIPNITQPSSVMKDMYLPNDQDTHHNNSTLMHNNLFHNNSAIMNNTNILRNSSSESNMTNVMKEITYVGEQPILPKYPYYSTADIRNNTPSIRYADLGENNLRQNNNYGHNSYFKGGGALFSRPARK